MIFDEYVFFALLTATFLMLFISYLAFRKRQLPVAKYCALVMLTASFYSFGYAFEMISRDLESIKFWLKIEYIGIPFISTFWFMLVLHYTGRQRVLTKRVAVLLFVIPVVTLVLHYTNDLHHFYYSDIQLEPGSGGKVKTALSKGPWYWVHISYNYLQALAGMILFLIFYMEAMPTVRKQIVILMLGAAAPWMSNLIYLLSPFPIEVDLTPLGFTFSGLFYLWGIYRFHLLRLVPVAMQTVFQTMEDGVVVLDYDLTILNANRAAMEIFSESRLLAGSALSVFADHPELTAILAQSGNGGGRMMLMKNGETRHYEVKLSVLQDYTLMGKMLMLHDVTDVTRYQEKLQFHARQLAEFSAFKDKLFAVVAHDIRDPLAMLVNATELLEEELEGKASRDLEMLQEVAGQVKNTYLLVEQLLDWFRSQRERMVYHPQRLNLIESVEQAMNYVKPRNLHKQVEIRSDIPEEVDVFADKGMLDLVLRNLLSNALKYTEKSGQIRMDARSDGEWVTVSVRDTGVGIGEERGRTLFHLIQEGSPGTEGETGTGLGLYLAEKFVTIHGGRIWFERNLDKGSTFFFTMPASKGEDSLFPEFVSTG